ncbi:uncharacterized protein LOC143027976 [Oratosquilla oratoria]|uniref:uncharacterized protein LOC143027976 n=1 Tax=Oratosquilla oratoria TaxID=337810 RepID=UPI003F762171
MGKVHVDRGIVRIGNSEYPYKIILLLPSLAWTRENQRQLNDIDITWTLPSSMKPHIKLQVNPSQPSVLFVLENLEENQKKKYLSKLVLHMPSLFSKDETADKRKSSLSWELAVPGLETLTFDATLENTENSRDINTAVVPWWRRSFILKAHVPFKSIGDIELEMKETPSDKGIQMTFKRKVIDKTILVQWNWAPSRAQLKVQTPLRTIEADLTTTSPYTLRIKPNVAKPKLEYEVSFPLTPTGFKMIFKDSNVTKRLEVSVSITQSTVDIGMDLCYQPENCIKLHAEYYKSTTGITRAQGTVISQVLEPHEIPFAVDIHRMPNETSYCHGYAANLLCPPENYFCSQGQTLFIYKLCAPAYIEGTLRMISPMVSDTEYQAQFGIRDPQDGSFVFKIQRPHQ